MATKKKTKEKTAVVDSTVWPKVSVGRHSTWIEHEDGRVEYQPDWDALAEEINQAINALGNQKAESGTKRSKKIKS